MAEVSRRRFLALAGGAAGATLAGTAAWSQLVNEQVHQHRSSTPAARPSRVLVVLELAGGNYGLNTLVPADGRYRDARPSLGIAEHDLVTLDGTTDHALHPALAPLAPVWAARHLGAIQGLGLERQSRSHFVATDAWRAGGQSPFATSWLGRWLDATAGDEATPLRAIGLGTDTRVLAAEDSLSTVVVSPDAFDLMAPVGPGTDAGQIIAAFEATAAPLSDDPLLAAAQASIPSTLQAVDVLARATGGSGSESDGAQAARSDRATALLDTAARIVGLDVGAQVLVVGVEGFDTHARQYDRHDGLLTDVGNGIARFLTAMEDQGRAEDVLLVTTSEFGRRVAENGSAGTDHGTGNVQFLAGAPVRGQIVGAPGLDRLVEGDLPIDIDTRSLYAVALDWLGGPTDEILGGSFDRFGLLAPPGGVSPPGGP